MRVTGTTVGPRFQCEGALAQLTSLKPAGLVFAGLVAALAAVMLGLLARRRVTQARA